MQLRKVVISDRDLYQVSCDFYQVNGVMIDKLAYQYLANAPREDQEQKIAFFKCFMTLVADAVQI